MPPKSLQQYALTTDPESLPPSVRVMHTSRTIAVFEKLKKAQYHFLLLPRPSSSWEPTQLISLKSVLEHNKATALELLKLLREESEPVVQLIQDRMVRCNARGNFVVCMTPLNIQMKATGCTWHIHRGFHAIQVRGIL